MSRVHKEGPFGVRAGTEFDIDAIANEERAPIGLVSIWVWTYNDEISAIRYIYKDEGGSKINKGPFGQTTGAKPEEIKIGQGEVITKVSGYFTAGKGRITELTFTSNIATYGPFGKKTTADAAYFETLNGNIVAFFGNYTKETSVDAIGTYYI